ncbi:universal stress protein [Halogeometricum limi]|uniref:Nucleotide-binding universal stress protein, UspA family n=1 Tax=Halogeometricum limi TaxID=555875 RepID=A0A1I6GHN7_9EURY|nr:universal stress protein [Halogeometricum limi]SFR41659.1 Nucleotide-binding universal stress protein, UspA family [Halogeometricum limi]
MYERILVPTDGSQATDRAVEHAVDLAKQYGASIHALYVVDSGAYASLEAGADIVLEALEDEGKQAVDHIVEAAEREGVDVTASVQTGTAYQTILDYADEEDCDVVVMGTHGRSGLNRYLLGSVTEKVVRSSDVPVLTVRTHDDG